MTDLDFAEDLKINPDSLDVEWLMQANLYGRYARESAEANDRLRRAEQRLKVIKSDLILNATENPNKYLGKDIKPTAQAVEAYYRSHPDHEEAKEDYFKASFEAEMMQNALYAMGHRKTALENLVKLHSSNYFATPREPRDLSKEYRERLAESRDDRYADQRKRSTRTR